MLTVLFFQNIGVGRHDFKGKLVMFSDYRIETETQITKVTPTPFYVKEFV